MTKLLDNMAELPKFIERQIPMLTHFQLCEGLKAVVGGTHPTKVLEFEKKKLDELDSFYKNHMTDDTNLKVFGQRLR